MRTGFGGAGGRVCVASDDDSVPLPKSKSALAEPIGSRTAWA